MNITRYVGLISFAAAAISSPTYAHCTGLHPHHCKVEDVVEAVKTPEVKIIEKVIKEGKNLDEAAKEVLDETRDKVNEAVAVLNDVDIAAIDATRELLGDDAANVVGFARLPQAIERSLAVVVTNKVADVLIGDKTLEEAAKETISLPLEVALQQAHDALDARAKPVPEDVKLLLAVHFAPEDINRARYVDGDFEANVAALINSIQTTIGDAVGGNHAVTVDDIIVFDTVPPVEEIEFWAHEVVHVEQYSRLGGIDAFAAEYLKNYSGLESEAETRAQQLVATLDLIKGIRERQAAVTTK